MRYVPRFNLLVFHTIDSDDVFVRMMYVYKNKSSLDPHKEDEQRNRKR